MKILKIIKTFLDKFRISLRDKNGDTLRDRLFKEYLNNLIKERDFIHSDETDIIKKSWYDGYAFGLKYYRNIQ